MHPQRWHNRLTTELSQVYYCPISNRHKNTVVPTVRTGAPARARSALDCGCSATAEFAERPRIHTERAQCALERALPIPAPPPSAHAPSGRDRAHAWGRHSCVRNAAEFGYRRIHTEECQWHDEVPYPSTNCARTALASLGSTPSSSLPSSEAKGGPFTGRRISLRFLSASPRTLFANPVSPHSTISNRSDPRLEMPESYRKQTTAPLSNRHRFTHENMTSRRLIPRIEMRLQNILLSAIAARPSPRRRTPVLQLHDLIRVLRRNSASARTGRQVGRFWHRILRAPRIAARTYGPIHEG